MNKRKSGLQDLVLSALDKQKVMKSSELTGLGISRQGLLNLVQSGIILQLGAGFYGHSSVDPFVGLVYVVSKFYPQAVISGITALSIHGLTDERIERIDIDIPRNASIRNRIVVAHRVPQATIVGVTRFDFFDMKIRVYNPERALSDGYRIDPDGPIFLKSLKRYVAKEKVNSKLISDYDEILGTNVLKAVRQELADV